MKKAEYDGLTKTMNKLLKKIPRVGSVLSRIYMWKNMLFNFMLIGASGLLLNWFLYEAVLRKFFEGFFGGTLIALGISTFIVFLWNYFWNWRFSLSIEAQVANMKKKDLRQLQQRVEAALYGWRDPDE